MRGFGFIYEANCIFSPSKEVSKATYHEKSKEVGEGK